MNTHGEDKLAIVPAVPSHPVARTHANKQPVERSNAVQAAVSQRDLELLYKQELSRLVGLAEWIVGSRAVAEEIVHDTFVRMVAKPPKLDERNALSAYVRTAVVRACRSKLRRFVLERKHRPTRVDHYEDAPRPDEDIRQALTRLPLRQRQVVVLRFYEDMTVNQIAADLGVSAGSVKTHLHRALQRLGKTLDERMLP